MKTTNRLSAIRLGVVCLVATVTTGCADSVLFVTKTSIGIDFDTKPPTASIAYDRTEGYLGPRYDNGAVPPVYGRILSDAAIFNAKVRQIYATGPAAQRVLHTEAECAANPVLCPSAGSTLEGGKRLMFFGTTTSTGLKVTFSPEYQYPDSFHFGYKRKEFSFIPVGSTMTNGRPVDTYPAVLAAIVTHATTETENSIPSAEIMTGQFFATGAAAEQLAIQPEIHKFFKNETDDAFRSYRDTKALQDNEAKQTLYCYMNLIDSEAMVSAWNNANQHQLFWETNRLDQLQSLKNAGTTGTEKAENFRKASQLYAADIAIVDGSKLGRTELLTAHRKHVCQLANAH